MIPGRAIVAFGRRVAPAAALLIATVIGATRAAAEDVPGAECELGIALALNGRPVAAESVFTSILTRRPGDAAAYTNLGNLQLIAGYPEAALAFYRRAVAADSADAGILLDQATALMILGRADEAEPRARLAVERAGGAAPAARMLGLHYGDDTGAARGAEATPLSREEVLQMLRTATGSVPADSTRARTPPDSSRGRARREGFWRAAGARADEVRASPTLVYWKH